MAEKVSEQKELCTVWHRYQNKICVSATVLTGLTPSSKRSGKSKRKNDFFITHQRLSHDNSIQFAFLTHDMRRKKHLSEPTFFNSAEAVNFQPQSSFDPSVLHSIQHLEFTACLNTAIQSKRKCQRRPSERSDYTSMHRPMLRASVGVEPSTAFANSSSE